MLDGAGYADLLELFFLSSLNGYRKASHAVHSYYLDISLAEPL